jgi:2-polyprenyl-3-methyl-5-hydroxy-6-metoxy-1,4-benzoquinol methylase
MDMSAHAPDQPTPDAFVGRMFEAGVAMLDVLSVYLGDRLGLYRSLAREGPATAAQLAVRASIDERYAREWLEQQAATGILEVESETADHERRRFRLPSEHAEALVDPDSPYSIAPLARSIVACASVMPQLLTAFRSGGGVPWSDYGSDMIEAQGEFNRPWLLRSFGAEHLPAVPDIHTRLQADPPARVADVACGVGWAAIAIARAYPNVTVDGFDLDAPSIELARGNAVAAGVADRVTFKVRDAAEPSAAGRYDLAVVIEAIHDLSRPVEVLGAIRQMLGPGGTAIIADEKSADVFIAPADAVERFLYGVSVTCCLPTAMTERPTAATGAVMRADTLRGYAAEAGFRAVDVLDLPHDFLRFYRLTP